MLTPADQVVAWAILGTVVLLPVWLILLVSYGLIREAARKRRERVR